MSALKGKIYWLVGASAGIGAALARELDRRGAGLVLSARSEEGLAEVAATLEHAARTLPLDVTDAEAVRRGAAQLGDIDGVIYMAGDYTPMTAQTWDTDKARQVSAVNYTGALNVLGEVVPGFVKRDHGHIVIIGSLAGFAGLAGAISYGASKAAVMHLAGNLHADLKNTGIRVQRINPGFVDTRLTRKNDFRMPFITTPEKAAAMIAAHMKKTRFSVSFPKIFSWYFKLKAIGEIIRS